MPTMNTKVALPIIIFIVLLLVVGGSIGYYMNNQNSEDNPTLTSKNIHCNVCGNAHHRNKFYQDVFGDYLQRTGGREEEEYGHRCQGEEVPDVSCGEGGVCWTINFYPVSEENFQRKEELKQFIGKDDWTTFGTSKGCLVDAHTHKWFGVETLEHAIENAPDKHLKDEMYRNKTHSITIRFCKTQNCNL